MRGHTERLTVSCVCLCWSLSFFVSHVYLTGKRTGKCFRCAVFGFERQTHTSLNVKDNNCVYARGISI